MDHASRMEPSLPKALFDRAYDKRKAAALELERQVRDTVSRGDRTRIDHIVQQLCAYLTQNPAPHANARNGGLIGLAGVGIALGQEVAAYLDQMMIPILACFSDPDPKTRYFACESFYNLAKVCKGEMLVYFNEIFVVLARLAADSEVSVKNGAELLDRLFKDIVCEAAPHYLSQYQNVAHIRARQDQDVGAEGGQNELDVAREKAAHEVQEHQGANRAFSLARFVPLLAERMQVVSPLTRNYIIGWIAVLDAVPDLQLVSYLNAFLPHLFQYLGDPNTDVRVATAEVLANFLREIREAAQHEREEPVRTEDCDQDEWVHSRRVRIEYDAILESLLEQVQHHDEEIQATTFEWITEFLHVVPAMVVRFTPRLISAVLPCLAHPAPAIQTAAIKANTELFAAVEHQLPDGGGGLDYFVTTNALKQHLLDQHDQTRLQALEWLMMLHAKSPTKLFSIQDGSISVLLRVLSDPSEEVILCDLRLLTQICSRADEHHFRLFLTDLLERFAADRRLLESWGSLIIRQLCVHLQTERVFPVLADILETYEDLEFASIMVQNLNMILVASQELKPLRRRIRALDKREHQQLFVRLYRCWSHNAISALCLCLLTQSYEHAYNVLRIFADLDVSLSMLLQVDKLVQLIESPIFTSLRLQLLEPEQHPFLVKCLYGMLMLLPQSSAFATLRNRLQAVHGLGHLTMPNDERPHTRYARQATPDVPWNELLQHFRTVQLRHERLRLATERLTDNEPRRRVQQREPAPFARMSFTANAGTRSARE